MTVYLCILSVGFCFGLRYRVALLGLVSALVVAAGCVFGAVNGLDALTIAKVILLSTGCLQAGYLISAASAHSTLLLFRRWTH